MEGGYIGRSDGKEAVVDLGIQGECVWIGLTEAIGRQEVSMAERTWRAVTEEEVMERRLLLILAVGERALGNS